MQKCFGIQNKSLETGSGLIKYDLNRLLVGFIYSKNPYIRPPFLVARLVLKLWAVNKIFL